MCAGMTFDYPWKTEADNYVDDFTPGAGAIIFTSQDGKGRVGCYSGPSGSYRTITSSVVFSVLEENETTRQELMAAYMEFFTGGTGVAQESGSLFSRAQITIANPSPGFFSAAVEVNTGTSCDLGIYDVTGRRIGSLFTGQLSSGVNNLSFRGNMAAGTYLVFGTIGDETVSLRTVLLK